jgi:hypothetical protein
VPSLFCLQQTRDINIFWKAAGKWKKANIKDPREVTNPLGEPTQEALHSGSGGGKSRALWKDQSRLQLPSPVEHRPALLSSGKMERPLSWVCHTQRKS